MHYWPERKYIEQIAHAKESIVRLDENCHVLSWKVIRNYEESDEQCRLLYFWGITDKKKYFYQEGGYSGSEANEKFNTGR